MLRWLDARAEACNKCRRMRDWVEVAVNGTDDTNTAANAAFMKRMAKGDECMGAFLID